MKAIRFHKEAEDEYSNAVGYYAAIRPELGGRLFDEVESLLLRIRRKPQRFSFLTCLTRSGLCHRFPYSVIFVDEPSCVYVVAVMHVKRRPGYWQKRLES